MINQFSAYSICRFTVAFVWFYHGIVPKLLGPHADELAMNMSFGLSPGQAAWLATVAGIAEVLFGVAVLVFWRRRWPLVASAFSMLVLLAFTAVCAPNFLVGAFNAVTTNFSVLALAIVALKLHEDSMERNLTTPCKRHLDR